MWLSVSSGFSDTQKGQNKVFFEFGAYKVGKLGLPWLRSSVVPGACLGAGWGFPGASALIVHQHTKIAYFRPFGAIAFLLCFNKSVLRHFLGGLFGFIGRGCIFGYLRAFAWLVGLYACNVRRLRTEKRKPR